jgi:hypothetical protein
VGIRCGGPRLLLRLLLPSASRRRSRRSSVRSHPALSASKLAPARRRACSAIRYYPSVKSRQRIIDHGEVFTPLGLVNDMLDLVAHQCESVDSRFLEPACGDGNFLAEVLRRKLRTVDAKQARNREKWERDAILSVCSLYGIDLLADNIAACRDRLLEVVNAAHTARFKTPFSDQASRAAAYILSQNIVQGDALTLRTLDDHPIVFPEWSPINGSLLKRRDYKFAHLIGHAEARAQLGPGTLFNEMGEDVYVPEPVGERPPCHYLKVADAENQG